MADSFPQSHTTTTSASYVYGTSSVTVRPYLDASYVKTVHGLIKVIQLVLDFICFICVVAGPYSYFGGAGWATFVSIVAFILTLILLIMYLFHMIQVFNFVPWILVEMLYCGLWVFFYLIAAIVQAANASKSGSSAWAASSEMVYCFTWTLFYFIASSVLAVACARFPHAGSYGAGAFFGFAAMLAYGIDCFLKFQAWRNGEVAQGPADVA